MKWKFLQDWDDSLGDRLLGMGYVYFKCQNGWIVLHDSNNDPVCWYDLEDMQL